MRETVPNLCHDAGNSAEIADNELSAPTRPTSMTAQKINKHRPFCDTKAVNVQGTSGDICAVSVPAADVKAVQREMQAWYITREPHTTPAFRAAYEDVMHGLDVYQMNKQMMSPELMRELARSVDALANYTYGTQR